MHGHVFYSKEETILENDHNTKEVKKCGKEIRQRGKQKEEENPGEKKEMKG